MLHPFLFLANLRSQPLSLVNELYYLAKKTNQRSQKLRPYVEFILFETSVTFIF